MIRCEYSTLVIPPAPFMEATLRCPTTGRQIDKLPAQADTGADLTVLTQPAVNALELVEVGRFLCQGLDSQMMELPLYLVEARLYDLPPLIVRVVLGKGEPWVLLGRDVLNAHKILLDGPQLALEIERPAAG